MEHPITPSPPPDLMRQWIYDAVGPNYEQCIATKAAQWGADQELEACCKWFAWESPTTAEWVNRLRAARRPKPPSLKEQALLQLDTLNADLAMHGRGCDLSQIRRALEQLND